MDPADYALQSKPKNSIEPRELVNDSTGVVAGDAEGPEESIGFGESACVKAFRKLSDELDNPLPGVATVGLVTPSLGAVERDELGK